MIRLGLALLLGLAAVYAFGSQWGWEEVLPARPAPPATERTRSLDLAPEAEEPAAPAQAASPAPPVREYPVVSSEWQESAAVALEPDAPPGDAPEIAAVAATQSDDVPIQEGTAAPDARAAEPDPLASLAAPPAPGPADLDRSADLVRRMLSLHRRAGPRR